MIPGMKYHVTITVPRYDNRDCVRGWSTHIVESHMTSGWAFERLRRLFPEDEMGMGEESVNVQTIDAKGWFVRVFEAQPVIHIDLDPRSQAELECLPF